MMESKSARVPLAVIGLLIFQFWRDPSLCPSVFCNGPVRGGGVVSHVQTQNQTKVGQKVETIDNNDVIIQNSLYYQYKCPYLNPKQPPHSVRSDEAREMSLNASVLPFIHSILDSGLLAGRKIVFIGDSLDRQMTESLACLAGHQRTTTATISDEKDDNDRTRWGRTHFYRGVPTTNDQSTTNINTTRQQQQQQQQQQPLKVYYSIHGGGLVSLDPKSRGFNDQSWIDIVCGDEHNNNTTTEHLFFMGSDPDFKRIELGPDDFVLIDGTHHDPPRGKNLKNIAQLGSCLFPNRVNDNEMSSRRRRQKNFPNFAVVQYSPVHWGTKNGLYNPRYGKMQEELAKDRGDVPCPTTSHPRERLEILKELKILHQKRNEHRKNRLPVLGQVSAFRALSLGRYHNGNGDCVHWLRPGFPDLVLKEIFEWILEQVVPKNGRD